MNPKFAGDNRRRLSETANVVGGHRGNFVGGTRGGEQFNWANATPTTPTTTTTTSTGYGTIPGTGYNVAPGSSIPVAPTAPPPESFFVKYKTPLLISGGVLLLSGLAYVALKK